MPGSTAVAHTCACASMQENYLWVVINIVIVSSHACPHRGGRVPPLHSYSNPLLQVVV